jgi:hypothetical protein
MNAIGGLLQQYGGANAANPPADVENHFDQAAKSLPQSELIQGITAAFQSGQTPPFAQMISQLFGGSNGQQQAGALTALLASAGPALLSQLTAGGGGLGNLASIFSGAAGSATPTVTPAQASQVTPEEIQDLAAKVEKKDPSVVERMSSVYAAHPGLFKTLGGAALTIALAKIAQRQQG